MVKERLRTPKRKQGKIMKHRERQTKRESRRHGNVRGRPRGLPMPIPFQLHNLKRLFLKANAYLGDPQAELAAIDWESSIINSFTYPENLTEFKKEYPQYY